jgi:hypothetical protein
MGPKTSIGILQKIFLGLLMNRCKTDFRNYGIYSRGFGYSYHADK